MPLPTFDKADDVPELFRPEYEERDGKWHPKVPDVTNLQSALDAERSRATTEEKERKKVERERDDLKRKHEAAKVGITDEQLQSLRDEDASKRKPIEDENTLLKAENRKLKLTDKVRAEALDKGVMSDRIKDAMKLLDGRTDLTDSGAIVVLDEDSKPTTETLEHFLSTTFKTEKPWLYQGSGASGSGASGSNGTNGSNQGTPATRASQIAEKRSQVAGAF